MKKGRLFISLFFVTAGTAWPQNVQRTIPSSQRPTISVASLSVPLKAREQLMRAIHARIKAHLEEALKEVNAALQTAPSYAEALSFRALLELDGNRLEECMSDLQHALRVDPSLAIAHLHMASLLNRRAQYDDALRSLERTERLGGPTWASAFEMAKAWLGKHEYEKTVAELGRSSKLGGEKVMASSIHMMRGDALYQLRKYEQATSELQLYLQEEPNGSLVAVAREMLDKMKTPLPGAEEVAEK